MVMFEPLPLSGDWGPLVPPPMPAPNGPPFAVTVPPLISMYEPSPLLPPPIPAPQLSPVAVTVPPLMVMLEPLPLFPPPMPAPPFAVSVPVPLVLLMVSLPSVAVYVPFFCKPAQYAPLFSVFSPARSIVTFPVLSSAIMNAQA